MTAAALDDLDRRLVHRLAEELPVDLGTVAAEIGTTVDDATQRLRRLRDAGVVGECVARIEPAAVGVGVTAFLLVRVAQADTGKLSLLPGFIRAQTCIVLETACDFVNADRVRLAGL